jgi:proteasome lid subunit RPN8/RPN11
MSTAKRRLIHEAERVNPIVPVHIWRSPAGSSVDMLIVAHLSAYSAIHEHSFASLPNETGGFLIGRVAFDGREQCWHLEIEQAVPVEPVTQNPMHFTFTWRDVDRIRSYREEHGKALLGWYHTHPDLPVFLSETDLERTHRVLFSEPFQIALVYDPVRSRAGYFFWEGAQKIDASQAPWREFEIAVSPDAEPVEPADGAAQLRASPQSSGDPEPARPAPAGSPAVSAPATTDAGPPPTVMRQAAPAPVAEASGVAEAGAPAVAKDVAEASSPTPEARTDEYRIRGTSELSSSDTHHRLRLTVPDEGLAIVPSSLRAARAVAAAETFSSDDTPVPAMSPLRQSAAVPSVPATRARGWALVIGALLLLAGLLTVAYFWLAPRQG